MAVYEDQETWPKWSVFFLKLLLNIKFQWISFLREFIDLKTLEIGLIRMLVHYYVCTSFGAVHKGRIPLTNQMNFFTKP